MDKTANLKRARLELLAIVQAIPAYDPLRERLEELAGELEELITELNKK